MPENTPMTATVRLTVWELSAIENALRRYLYSTSDDPRLNLLIEKISRAELE